MKILLAAATEAEIAPVREWLDSLEENDPVHDMLSICITGVGLMAATYALTRTLAGSDIGLVIGAGIAGAFNKVLAIGECVVVESEQLADFGAEDGDAFLDVFSMGLVAAGQPPFTQGRLVNPLQAFPLATGHLRRAAGLTVLTVSGYEPTIETRRVRHNADVESMEGAALHYVCLQMGTPFIQLRTISNYVTRRDRSAWKIGEAVAALNAQLIEWLSSSFV